VIGRRANLLTAGEEAQVRRSTGLARCPAAAAVPAVVVAVLAVVLGGCATPAYRFVGSSDHDVVLKVPRGWSQVNAKDALKASGVDPATVTGWTVFYDAASKPSAQDGQTKPANAPVLRVESVDVPEADRSQLTAEQMRELVLPGDDTSRATAAAAGQFKLMVDKPVTSKTEVGAHVVFSLVTSTSPVAEVYDQVALTDPKRTRVHLLTVHCTQACYAADQRQIDNVVTSLTLKSK
jgi:hypothetical protein